jgi:hypothetical protein
MSWFPRIAKWFGTEFLPIAGHDPAASASSGGGGLPLTVAAAAPVAVIYIVSSATGPLRQGEILSDVLQRRRSFQSLALAIPEIDEIRHPYSIVITQDCDLEQDHTARNGSTTAPDKLIPNVLLVQMVTVKELLAGLPKGKDILKRVIQNRDERYHVFEQVAAPQDAQGQGLPALGADFKRYFAVPTDELYVQLGSGVRRRTQLNSTYLEHFSQRFASYLSRVALPKEHQVE